MLIKAKVTAGSSREEVTKVSGDTYNIKVKEKAKNNLANRRVIEILQNEYGRASIVRIIKGNRKRSKIISVN